jgi:hypothetical protein
MFDRGAKYRNHGEKKEDRISVWYTEEQTSYDQNVQLILKSYLPVVYGTPWSRLAWFTCSKVLLSF